MNKVLIARGSFYQSTYLYLSWWMMDNIVFYYIIYESVYLEVNFQNLSTLMEEYLFEWTLGTSKLLLLWI